MSQEFRGIIPDSNDPLMRYIIKLQNIINKKFAKEQTESVDSDNEDIFAQFQMVESAVKIHTLNGVHEFPFTVTYIHPFEPDYDKLKLWIRGHVIGTTVKDQSCFNHTITLNGDPALVDGTLNLGTNTSGVLSIASRYNSPTSDYENEMHIAVTDASDIQTDAIVTGFSEFMRFRILALSDQDGLSLTLWEKIDDSTPNDARMMQVRDSGRLLYIVRDGGVTYAKWTAVNVIEEYNVNANPLPYDVVATYTVAAHVIHIYVNGVDQTLTDFTGAVNWHDTLTNHEVNIFRRGAGTDGGHVYGDFYDYRLYAEKILSQTEVTRFYTNKWSISNIAFGAVAIVDHFATWAGSGGAPDPSFTTTSFTSQSFTV